MSPELVDEAILEHCRPTFLKVARVIYDAAEALGFSTEAKLHFIAKRIKALATADRLESAGNLDHWGYSEIRLREKRASDAVAEVSRRRETAE
ncbi:MAG: DUF3658 domain-containing protein [Bradyrhizobium sp.]|jgi:hypothetical protein